MFEFLTDASPTVDPNSPGEIRNRFDKETDQSAKNIFRAVLQSRQSMYAAFWNRTMGLSPQEAAQAKGAKCVAFFLADQYTVEWLLRFDPECIAATERGVPAAYIATPNQDGTVTITEKK